MSKRISMSGGAAMLALFFALAGCSSDGPTIQNPPGSATGSDGSTATDGTDGADGTTSTDGTDGATSTDGTDGATSTDGGCTAKCDGKDCGPDGCGGFCGICAPGTSCTTEGICTAPTCEPKCEGKECGPDGCGGFCGVCDTGKACNGAGICTGGDGTCTPDCTDKECGDDGCGNQCGKCPPGAICDANNQCEVDTSQCGEVDDVGKCEQDDTIAVTCKAGKLIAVVCDPNKGLVCGYNPAKNKHECLKGSCSPTCEGKECGPDGCGGICGQCQPGQTCNANGLCQEGNDCTPNCSGKECGPDGCGGQCGICDEGTNCVQGTCVDPNTCTPSCDGKSCGPDGCGGSCGTCKPDEVCQTGVCNKSDCTPNCIDKACGDDGCGGSCGTCDEAQICNDDGFCVIQGGGACGDLTFEGQCINNSTTVQWCEGGEVKEQNCSAFGEDLLCGWVLTQETYWCVDKCQVGCLGKECGDDTCGGSCGTCDEGQACNSTGQCVTQGGGGECGDVSFEGICEGITLKYCSGESLVEVNCGEFGLTCGWQAEFNWNGCITDPNCTPNCLIDSGDPENPTVKQCGDDGCGNLCGVCGDGETCEEGLCVEGGTSECGDVTVTGECSGDTLEYCANGQLFQIDCALSGQVCGFDDESAWYDCMEPTVAPTTGPIGGDCGLLTTKGYCADNTVNYCKDGAPETIACNDFDMYCAFNPAADMGAGSFDCVDPPACISGCPDGQRCQADGTCGCDGVDFVGQCEGETLVYCDNDQLNILDCASIDNECGYNGTFFLCVPPETTEPTP